MADAKLEVLLSAKNTAGAAFKRMEMQIKVLTSAANLMNRALAGALAGVTIAGAVRGLNSLTDAARDFEETANKVRVVFGDQLSDVLDKWARNAAENMGLARQEALDAVGSIGYMFQQIGANSAQAVTTSQSLVQLAADIASFNNVAGGASRVLEDMQSAFLGEYDPIQKYIGTINAAAVEHEALARTGKKSKDELTQLEKTMAAVAVITRDAGVASGDYARTSGGLANQQRELESRLKDLQVEMGKNLVPLKLKMVSAINEWIEANGKLLQQDVPRWIDTMITGLGKLITAGSETIRILKEIGENYSEISHDREDLLARAAKYVHAGLVDLNEVLSSTDRQLSDILDKLDKTTRITEEGGIRYKIGRQTEGYEDYKSGPPPAVNPPPTPGATGQGVFDTSSQEFNAALDSSIADYRQMIAAQVRIPDKDLGIDIADMVSLNLPGDAAEQSFRDIEEKIKKRNALMQKGNDELLEITQYTAEQMQSSLADFFFDAITGELKTFEDYWRSFWQSMARMASEAIAQILIQKAIGESASSSGGSGGGNYGWVGALVNFVGNMATRDSGGPVAPGGMYEIGVPEILRTGGKQYLMMGGNQGGYVEPLKEGGQDVAVHLRNINVLDPSIVEEWANSPSGERVILNVMRRNQ